MHKATRTHLGTSALVLVVAMVLFAMFASIAAAEPSYTGFCSNCHSAAGSALTINVTSPPGADPVTYSGASPYKGWAAYDLSDNLKVIKYGDNYAPVSFSAPAGHLVRVCASDGAATGTWTQAYLLTPKLAGASEHGHITPATAALVAPNGGETFTFSADSGYHVSEVKIDGEVNAAALTAGQYAFTNAAADHTIQVTIAANGFVITSTAGTGGTISPLGDTTVAAGGSQAYTITPDAGYTVATLTVDGAAVAAANSYTFSNVTAAHTIAVTFKVAKPTVSLALTGLKSGKLTLGKKVTCAGVLKPARAAKATLTFQRKVGTKWVKVTAKSVAVNATSGKYTFAYKPTKKGAWRVQAVVAASGAWTKATSVYKTFTVK